jgi:predicted nucleic acid-binding Zn ribbon protein
MSFQSLNQIIQQLETQPEWEIQRQYRRLVASWSEIVEPKVAKNSRPVYLFRQILHVATSNSVWSQTLVLKRLQILKKINILFPDLVKELRFSSAHWNQAKPSDSTHPSDWGRRETVEVITDNSDIQSPQSTFNNWIANKQIIAEKSPLCPKCSCPTPVGELERWSMCAFCITKEWSQSK